MSLVCFSSSAISSVPECVSEQLDVDISDENIPAVKVIDRNDEKLIFDLSPTLVHGLTVNVLGGDSNFRQALEDLNDKKSFELKLDRPLIGDFSGIELIPFHRMAAVNNAPRIDISGYEFGPSLNSILINKDQIKHILKTLAISGFSGKYRFRDFLVVARTKSEFKRPQITRDCDAIHVAFNSLDGLATLDVKIDFIDSAFRINHSIEYNRGVQVFSSGLILKMPSDEGFALGQNKKPFRIGYVPLVSRYAQFQAKLASQKFIKLSTDPSEVTSSFVSKMGEISAIFYSDHWLHHPKKLFSEAGHLADLSAVKVSAKTVVNAPVLSVSLTNFPSPFVAMANQPIGRASHIFTEHADNANLQSSRALFYGDSNISNPEDSVGGFAHHGIPMTKSVFYHNDRKAQLKNYPMFGKRFNSRFIALVGSEQASIKGSSDYFRHLLDLKNLGNDICLHTPSYQEDSLSELAEALAFMQSNFGS